MSSRLPAKAPVTPAARIVPSSNIGEEPSLNVSGVSPFTFNALHTGLNSSNARTKANRLHTNDSPTTSPCNAVFEAPNTMRVFTLFIRMGVRAI